MNQSRGGGRDGRALLVVEIGARGRGGGSSLKITIRARIKRISRSRTVLEAGLITGDPLPIRRLDNAPEGLYKIHGGTSRFSSAETRYRFVYSAVCLTRRNSMIPRAWAFPHSLVGCQILLHNVEM